jgi:hypothetical protein
LIHRNDSLCAIYQRLAYLDQYTRDTTATNSSDRTDFLDGVPLVIVEERDLSMADAKNDIISKAQWIPNFHSIPFYFGIAITRTQLEILLLSRNNLPETVFKAHLANQYQRWACVIAAINIARTLLLFRNSEMITPSLLFGVWHIRNRKQLRLTLLGHEIKFPDDPVLYKRMRKFYKKTKDVPFIEHMRKIDQTQNRICLTPLGIVRRPSNPEELRVAFRHICTAVFGLHDHHYLHCDIRWSNIVDAYGSWTLIDCEYACHMDEKVLRLERSNIIKGAYVLQQSQEWDQCFDLYQVGLLLTEYTVDKLIDEEIKRVRNLITSRVFQYEEVREELRRLFMS